MPDFDLRRGPVVQRGLYVMDEPGYRADPCPTPSLTQSVAKTLIERSPAHAWIEHPRLNPAFEPDDATQYDIGNVAHRLLLGRGKDFVVVNAADWRTKAAQETRRAAAEDGMVAILAKDHERAVAMVAALQARLSDSLRALFGDEAAGHSEVCVAWDETGIWCRSLIDRLSADLAVVIDYKTTRGSAAPHALGAKMVEAGWDVQAAMIERGLDAVQPEGAGRRRFLFVCQEVDAPHAVTVAALDEHALTMGRKKVGMAIALWRRCIESGEWPGYPSSVVRPDYPAWAEHQWLAREMAMTESGDWPHADLPAPCRAISPPLVGAC